jgi:hypothetical protein
VGVSILFILFSYRLWCSGINHYESAGSWYFFVDDFIFCV